MTAHNRAIRLFVTESQPNASTRVGTVTALCGSTVVATVTLTHRIDRNFTFMSIGKDATFGALHLDVAAGIHHELTVLRDRLERKRDTPPTRGLSDATAGSRVESDAPARRLGEDENGADADTEATS